MKIRNSFFEACLCCFVFLFAAQYISAQDFTHPATGTVNFTASGTHNYYDSGGPGCDITGNGAYNNSADATAIICPQVAGTPVTIEFFEVDIETRSNPACYDFLYIHDGNSTSAPLVFSGCGEEGWQMAGCPGGFVGDGSDGGAIEGGPNDIDGTNDPTPVNNIFTSTDASGCLTVRFTSDSSVDQGGWIAEVTAAAPPPPSGAPIPTMSEWGMIIFALIMLSFGLVFVMRKQTALAGMGGATSSAFSSGLPFDKKSYGKALIYVMLGLAVTFAVAVGLFGYEMTNADVPGSLIAGPILAYLAHLIMMANKQEA